MNSDNALLIDMVRKLCKELSQTQMDATGGGSMSREHLWQKVEDFGLPYFMLPADAGGFDGGWATAAQLFQLFGEYALPLPVGEAMIARHYLHRAQSLSPQELPKLEEIPISLAHCRDAAITLNGDVPLLSGALHNVAWTPQSDLLLSATIGDRSVLALLARDQLGTRSVCEIDTYRNTAAEPRAHLRCRRLPLTALWHMPTFTNLMTAGALLRSAQMSGAMQSILNRSINYVLERKQFGRAIGKFQVIQHDLARLAEQVAAAQCAALSAARAADTEGGTEAAEFEIAAAKLRTNIAVAPATTIAHQVHGAIGFTLEHPLHQFTQRLFAWRSDFGNDRYWALTLGNSLRQLSGVDLWPFLTARSDRQVVARQAGDGDEDSTAGTSVNGSESRAHPSVG